MVTGHNLWEYFDSPVLTESRLLKEMQKAHLTRSDLIALDRLMDRVAAGTAVPDGDFKHLRVEGLWELRLKVDRRSFRLLYSREGGTKFVMVALHFVPKKSQKLPRHTFETARKRLKSWQDKQHQDETSRINDILV